jgi:mono/diheme cytochrome c family protein
LTAIKEFSQENPECSLGCGNEEFGAVVMNRKCAGLALLATVVACTDPVLGQPLPWERGHAIAEKHCARCHAVDEVNDSPMGLAPSFRELSKRYVAGNPAQALAEAIVTGHPAMPRFTFEPREVDALLAFLVSLSPPGERPPPRRQ